MNTTTPADSAPAPTAIKAHQDELVVTHMPLVGHIVRETLRRVPSHVNRDDLTSAGLTALVLAARAYDEERGVPFDRYATTRIRGALLDELRSIDWASRSVRRRARDLSETRSALASALGRTPTASEVASATGLSEEEITANDDDVARAQVLSLQGSATTPIDELIPTRAPSPEDMVEQHERLVYLREAIEELPERLRMVVENYFFDERPMAEIAAELGVTDSRISQMRAEALVMLRDVLNHELEPANLKPATGVAGGVAHRRREAYFAAVASRHAQGARPALRAVGQVAG